MRKHSFLYLFLCFIIACQDQSNGFQMTAEEKSMADMEAMQIPKTAESAPPPSESEENQQEQRIRNSIEKASKIIKDGDVSIEVNNLQIAKVEMDCALNAFDAYYEKEHYQNQRYRSAYYLTVRIPSENFDAFLGQIESGKGKVISKQIQARDVTEEYVDIAVRLNNNQTYLKRYRALLEQAKTIQEILDIQEKIRRIEEEIDARKGRLQFIDDQVRFSTLRLELFENHEVTAERKARNFGQQLTTAFRDGVDVFLDFLLFLVNIWPFVILFGIFWFYRKRINWRFWRRNDNIGKD